MTEEMPSLLISGAIASGKTTLADQMTKYGYIKMSLADGVKEMTIALDPAVAANSSGDLEHLSDFGVRVTIAFLRLRLILFSFNIQ